MVYGRWAIWDAECKLALEGVYHGIDGCRVHAFKAASSPQSRHHLHVRQTRQIQPVMLAWAADGADPRAAWLPMIALGDGTAIEEVRGHGLLAAIFADGVGG